MHTHYDGGIFRLWLWNFSTIEIAFRWGLSMSLEFPSEWHEENRAQLHIHLGWPCIFIGIPWPVRYKDHGQCSGPRFGFAFHDAELWLYHGNSTGRWRDGSMTAIKMPWSWQGIGSSFSHEVLNKHGDWVPYLPEWEGENDGRVKQIADYTYTLKSGEVQERKATIFVERRTWSRVTWFPFKMIRPVIDISFDDEVGEKSGSWKGGCLGCSYDILPGDLPIDSLRRMEREREF